jgi:hypothetical protein
LLTRFPLGFTPITDSFTLSSAGFYFGCFLCAETIIMEFLKRTGKTAERLRKSVQVPTGPPLFKRTNVGAAGETSGLNALDGIEPLCLNAAFTKTLVH